MEATTTASFLYAAPPLFFLGPSNSDGEGCAPFFVTQFGVVIFRKFSRKSKTKIALRDISSVILQVDIDKVYHFPHGCKPD